MRPPGAGRAYCNGRLKRGFDLIASALGLLAFSPLLLVVAVVVRVSSGSPVLFVQKRAGRYGRPFPLLKFRTMRQGSEAGLAITGLGDPRVTLVGRFLRATKLDELPQLVNVLKGDMSLVGPRPEVPRYVECYSPGQRRVLEVRPGLTDPATVLFRNEEFLLGRVEDDRKERHYKEEILPKKLGMNLEYLERASLPYDLHLLLRTLLVIVLPNPG
jgi:lipopolysaccharide/colanic/teichoic acid biosynthesis glycosyltransferase